MIDGKAYHTNLSDQRIISAPYLNLVPAAPITECLSVLMTILYSVLNIIYLPSKAILTKYKLTNFQ